MDPTGVSQTCIPTSLSAGTCSTRLASFQRPRCLGTVTTCWAKPIAVHWVCHGYGCADKHGTVDYQDMRLLTGSSWVTKLLALQSNSCNEIAKFHSTNSFRSGVLLNKQSLFQRKWSLTRQTTVQEQARRLQFSRPPLTPAAAAAAAAPSPTTVEKLAIYFLERASSSRWRRKETARGAHLDYGISVVGVETLVIFDIRNV